ncbi:MAG: RHS repeat protein, partial [Coriobacteriia bacterium]|nr:RHS repeat protein [Coriobacteriia bacterium]
SGSRAPVRIARDGVEVEIDLLGAAEGTPLALGNQARYPGVGPDVDLIYECLSSGVKQTLVLASAAAPPTFTFRLFVRAGELRQGFDGAYGIFAAADDDEPVFTLGQVAVWDAAGMEAEVGTQASMAVEACADGAYLTYSVDPAWLAEPARTFPVFLDPTLVVETDTYVRQGAPTSGYPNATLLKAGKAAVGDEHIAYLRFAVRSDTSGINLRNAYVRDATFQVWAKTVDPTCPTARLGQAGYFAPSVNWNTRPALLGAIGSQAVSQSAWSYWPITATARKWADPDYGSSWGSLQLYQLDGNGVRFYKEYNSNEASNYKPKIMIDHVIPAASFDPLAKSAYLADGADVITQRVTVTAGGYRTHIRQFGMRVGSTANTELRWFETEPPSPWVSLQRPGGYFAYKPSETAQTIPLLEQCSSALTDTGRTFTFAYATKPTWGDVQNNRHQWSVVMHEAATWSGSPALTTSWQAGGSSFNVVPAIEAVSAETAPYEWFTEVDSDGDGFPDNAADEGAAGRGSASLSWEAHPSATGYKVLLSDGATYRQVGTTAAGTTTWSSAGKGIYPSDTRIADLMPGSNPFLSGDGLELRDDPNPLYRATAGASDTRTHYELRVVPFNSGGDGAAADVSVQLPNRTLGVNDEAKHTTYDLGEIARHATEVELDTGVLQADVTDLAIASWGPGASVARHYASDDHTPGLFAPGWSFNFEQRIELDGNRATYVDESGKTHTFVRRQQQVVKHDTGGTAAHNNMNCYSWNRNVVRDASGTLHAVYADLATKTVYYVSSTDDAHTWSAPAVLATSSNTIYQPYLRIDGNNRVHAFWPEFSSDYHRVNHRYKDAGGAWSAKVVIGAGHSSDEVAFMPNPAIMSNNTLELVYDRGHYLGIGRKVWSGSAWSGTSGVLTAAYDHQYQNTVAVGSDLYYFFRKNADTRLYMARRVSNTWYAPVMLTSFDSPYHNEVVDADGNIWVFVSNYTPTYKTIEFAKYTRATNSWSAWSSFDAQGETHVYLPSATRDARGNVWVFYNVGPEIHYKVLDGATQQWSDRAQLTDRASDGDCYWPKVRYQDYHHAQPDRIELTYRQNTTGDASTYRLYYATLDARAHDASYVAPRGFHGELTETSGGFRLELKGGRILEFSEDGTLVREADRHGNATTYTYAGGGLTITAANGQHIDVAFEDGKVVSATYATADGTRTVTYDTSGLTWGASWGSCTVRYFPGTSDEQRVRYTYDLCYNYQAEENYYLSRIDVPYLPSHQWGVSDIHVTFDYFAGTQDQLKVTSWSFGGPGGGGIWYERDSRFDPMPNGVTVQHGDTAIRESGEGFGNNVYQEFEWHPNGATARKSNALTFDDPVRNWTYEYAAGGEVVREASPMGAERYRAYDARGNLVREQDADGGVTTHAYDSNDDLVCETDARGSSIYRTYDPPGTLVAEERVLNAAGERSSRTWTYDAAGRVTREEAAIGPSETPAVTTYGDFAASGEPREVNQVGVKMSASGQPQTLTERRTYDAFGNLVGRENAAGEVEETNVYSIGGRLTSSTDLAGATTVSEYDDPGRLSSSYRSKAGEIIERTDYTRNACDQVTLEEHYLGGDLAFTIEHHYNQRAQERRIVHSISGTTDRHRDARGNVVIEVDPDARQTRRRFDFDGRLERETAPGQSVDDSTLYTYSAEGRLIEQKEPDGSWTAWEYDAAGNQVKETRPHESGATVSDLSLYDLGGRLVQLTKAAGTDEEATTEHTYDWLGRVTTSALGEASSKTYNTLGWVLSEQDADGIQTLRTYDALGRVLAESVGGKTTTSTYELGRLKAQTNPQGRTTSYTYDDFGRVTLETHLQGAAEIKSIETAYDALSRAVATTQTAGPARTVAATSRLTYAAGSTKHSSMTTSYGGASTTVTYDSSDRETTRTTTFAGGASARSTTSRDGEDRATAWSTDGEASSASYDASGKLTGQAGLGWAGSSSGASYTYDSDTGRKV